MSEGKDEGQEKTNDPTPERLRKAREKGDVAKSTDVTAAASYLGLLAALTVGGAFAARGTGDALYIFLAQPDRIGPLILGPAGMSASASILSGVLWAISPILIVPFLFTIIALYAQQAVVVAPSKLVMKLSRISIISNAKQKFGATGIFEFLKSTVKLVAISIVLGLLLSASIDHYIAMPMLSGNALPDLMRDEGIVLLLAATVVAIFTAIADYFWRLFDHRRKLRMTFQEVRDEAKESEGDPHMKQSRQRRAREIATNRMMSDVPDADVIIVNPTHYAVALKWSRAVGTAPTVVAKGVDEIALRIREIATENRVPIMSDPPTARLLHATIDIGMEIEPSHYKAVAAAIRFADEMRKKAKPEPAGAGDV
jgi:flagellar biosynthetic protein FlhB